MLWIEIGSHLEANRETFDDYILFYIFHWSSEHVLSCVFFCIMTYQHSQQSLECLLTITVYILFW